MRSCESPILTLFFRDPDLASMASGNTLTGPQIFLIPTLITEWQNRSQRKETLTRWRLALDGMACLETSWPLMPPSSEGHHWGDLNYPLSHGTGGTLNVFKIEEALTSSHET